MGAQTVAQISNFYTGRYFWDDCVKNYDRVPDEINGVTLNQIHAIAQVYCAKYLGTCGSKFWRKKRACDVER